MLLQATEYRDIGVHRVAGWIGSGRKNLQTETARRIAEAAVTLSSWPGVIADPAGIGNPVATS